ncbi:zinc finger and SCAN domain-containing protein 22-like [Gigantopelta aegis]|uniref:zinc finger and SCAN domain-containing protein 22-like n=1 Tax=Gigantopelta aegis TaxID=1735272 RepID=UPI001B8875FB|nr:zinc finger and SCAN domain-containing protein 22-like [Gigantopelta aegis]
MSVKTIFSSDSHVQGHVTNQDVTEHDVTAHDVAKHDVTEHDVTEHDVTEHAAKHDVAEHDVIKPQSLPASPSHNGNAAGEPNTRLLSEMSPNAGSGLSKSLGHVAGDVSQSSSTSDEQPQTDSEDDVLDALWLRNKIAAETSRARIVPMRRKAFSESEATSRSERCDLCGESFATALQLRRHVMVHTRQRSLDLPSKKVTEPPQQCTKCKKVFENVTYLEKHKLRRHSSEKYTCDVCLLTFDTKKERDAHRRSHFGENPFSCRIT